MKKLLVSLSAILLLTSCGGQMQAPFDLYEERREDDIVNIYETKANEFHLSTSWYASEEGQLEKEVNDKNEVTVSYTKNVDYEYTNLFTTVMGPFADFTYLNFVAKGEPGKGIAFRAYYGEGENELHNVLGDDVSFSLTTDYKIHSLKVRGTLKSRMDLLSKVCIYPEIGLNNVSGSFTFKDVYFSKTLPDEAIWENQGVDTGDTSVRVNGWRTEGWTKYTLYDAGNNKTGVSYTKPDDYAFVERNLEIGENDNGLLFSFENKILNKELSVTCIRFLLRGDVLKHVDEGVEYEYDIYYEDTIYIYDNTKAKEVQPNENGLITLELNMEEALLAIGDHHQNGYRLTLLIESHPDDTPKYRRARNGHMIINEAKAYHGEFPEEKEELVDGEYSEYESSTYTIKDKEGVEKNITYTSIAGNAYWPRVCRSTVSKHDDVITIRIRNNGENSVRVAVHAGIMKDLTRSDSANNFFFPLYKNNGLGGSGYFEDGSTHDIAGGETIAVTVKVDDKYTDTEKDVIDVIQFLIDNCYGDEKKRSGDIDIVSVTFNE